MPYRIYLAVMALAGFMFGFICLLQQLLGTTTGMLATLLGTAFIFFGASAAAGYRWVDHTESRLARLEQQYGQETQSAFYDPDSVKPG